jgi:uncharacterized membrane protein (DUF2068 family)
MTHPTSPRRRPRAATALGWLLIIEGLAALAIFGALLAVLLAVQAGALVLDLAALSDPDDRSPILLSAGAGLASVFSLVSGVGLLRLQAWAWLLALITQGMLLLVGLIDYWLGSPDYVTLALGVVQVYLLNRADVQQAIRPAGPHAAKALPAAPAAAREPADSA